MICIIADKDKIADVQALKDKLEHLAPQPLSYVAGAVDMALVLAADKRADDDKPA